MSLTLEQALKHLADASRTTPTRDEIDSVRLAIVDVTAVSLAGWQEPSVVNFRDTNGVSGGWSSGLSVSEAAELAMLEAMSAHTLDFDDLHRPSATHLSSVLLPAVLATESLAQDSGIDVVKTFIAAHRCATILAQALGGMGHYARGWHSTATIGGPGTAFGIACGLGLSPQKAVDSATIAATLASGSRQNFGTDMKPIQVGNAASTAIRAVALANRGFTVDAQGLSGPLGYQSLYGVSLNGESLPQRWSIDDISQYVAPEPKLSACCFALQQTVEAAAEIRGVRADQVTRISLEVSPGTLAPLQMTWPTTRREAQFSIPFVVMQTLRSGGFGLMDLPAENLPIQQPQNHPVVEASENENGSSLLGRVRLEIEAGEKTVSTAKGDTGDKSAHESVSMTRMRRKVEDCISYAGSGGNAEQLFAAVDRFVDARDSSELKSWCNFARNFK